MASDERSLHARLDAIERRLEAIERHLEDGVPALPTPTSLLDARETTSSLIEETSIVSIVSLIGRTLMVLGGAFLIRFMTESQMLPQFAGTIVGIAYALFWVALADRAARKERYESATFHGVAAAMIGFPLLWETTLKFAYLTPLQSAVAVTIFTAIPLAVAGHRDMRGVALVIGAPAAVSMLALGFATTTLPPFLSALLLLGVATLVLAYQRKWLLLGVCVACIGDVGIVVATVMRLLRPEASAVAALSLTALCLVQMALIAVYFGTSSLLVFLRNRNLSLTEVSQLVVVLLIGFGGFIGVAHSAPDARPVLGLALLVLTAACYVGAYYILERDPGRSRTFVVYSTVATAAALVSTSLLVSSAVLPIVLALSALACSTLGNRRKSVSLAVHGAVYIMAAAGSSGLAWGTTLVLAGRNLVPEFWTYPAPWSVFLVSLAVTLMQPGTSDNPSERALRRAGLPAMVLTAITLAALAVSLSFGLRPEIGEREVIESSILRTAVICVAAVLLALLSRRERFAQSKWLVIPCLIVGAAKLIAQDLPSGRPSVLFGCFAIFGAALIIAPRLLRIRA